jgi:hypothetical protein
MEKESLAQSTARDRATTSVVIDGIAIEPEECGDISGAHYFCVRIAVARSFSGSDGGRVAGYILAVLCVAWVVEGHAHVALELVPNDQSHEHFETT